MGDFIVTIHALDRMQQRFTESFTNDARAARTMLDEIMGAIDGGRISKVAPLELSSYEHERWIPAKKNALFAWTRNKDRGYVMSREGDDITVLTVLVGDKSRCHSKTRVPFSG